MKFKLAYSSGALCLLAAVLLGCSPAAKREKLLRKAEAHLKAGDYDRAEIEYLNVARLDPTNYVARRQLGIMSFEQGRVMRSYFMLSSIAKLKADDYEVQTKFATVLLAVGRVKEAREETLAVLSLQPTNQEALVLLVDTSSTTNEMAEARQQLENLREVSGGYAGYYMALGTLALRGRDTNAGAQMFRKALELDPKLASAHMGLGGIAAFGNDRTNALNEFKAAAELGAPRTPYRLRYLDYLIGVGEVEEAKPLLAEMVKQTPDYLPGLLRSAQLAMSEQRFAEAEAALKSLLNREQAHLEGMLLMARLRIAQNQPDKAVAELERVLKFYPRLPQVHFQMAVAYLLQNDLASAIKSLNEALTLQPDYTEASTMLAELYIRRGDVALAVNLLTRLIERRPNLTQPQLLLATAYRSANRLDEAIQIYDRISLNYPTNPQPAFMTGLVQRQQNKPEAARRSFEKALSFSPNFLVAVEQLINLDVADKKYAEAEQRAQREVDRMPTNAAPYLLLARVHLAQTNAARAEAVLTKALEVSPDSSAANSLLAQVYVAARKHEAALEKLHQMVSRNTNDIASWLMIAELNSAASNYSAARGAYEAVLAVDPRSGQALNNLAYLLSEKLNEPRRAYELANKARELQPRDPYTSDTFGWVLFKNGDYVRALSLIQESSRILSEQPEVTFHLGMIHYVMGEESAARVALQNAVALAATDAPWKPEAMRRLRILELNPSVADAAAVKELEEFSAKSPDDPILIGRLAALAERDGNRPKAIAAYEKSLQLNTNLVPAMVRLARLYAAEPRNPERAMTLARRARALEPKDATIAHTLGRLAYDSAQSASDYQWAWGLLQEGARAMPDQAAVQFDAALGAYAVGDVYAAAGFMRKALTLKPTVAEAEAANQFLEFHRLWTQPNEIPAAAPRTAQVLGKTPNYVPALLVDGLAREQQKDFAGARNGYEKILKIYPLFSPAMRGLALLYAQNLNDPQKAYDYGTKAREAFPQDMPLARALGVLAYKRGDYQRAVPLLRECAATYPQDSELFYTLGFAQYQLKQSRDSKESLNKALTLAPEAAQAAEAKRILSELK